MNSAESFLDGIPTIRGSGGRHLLHRVRLGRRDSLQEHSRSQRFGAARFRMTSSVPRCVFSLEAESSNRDCAPQDRATQDQATGNRATTGRAPSDAQKPAVGLATPLPLDSRPATLHPRPSAQGVRSVQTSHPLASGHSAVPPRPSTLYSRHGVIRPNPHRAAVARPVRNSKFPIRKSPMITRSTSPGATAARSSGPRRLRSSPGGDGRRRRSRSPSRRCR